MLDKKDLLNKLLICMIACTEYDVNKNCDLSFGRIAEQFLMFSENLHT